MCILYPTPSINQEILDEVHRCWEKEAFSFHLLPFFFYINIINNIHLKKKKKERNQITETSHINLQDSHTIIVILYAYGYNQE